MTSVEVAFAVTVSKSAFTAMLRATKGVASESQKMKQIIIVMAGKQNITKLHGRCFSPDVRASPASLYGHFGCNPLGQDINFS